EPEGIAVSPDGSKVYVTAETSNTVSVLDAATGRLRKTIPVGENPRTVALTPDGRRAYVTAEAGGNVTILDVATDSVLGQFPIRWANGPTTCSTSPREGENPHSAQPSGRRASQEPGRRARTQPSTPQVRPARVAKMTMSVVISM